VGSKLLTSFSEGVEPLLHSVNRLVHIRGHLALRFYLNIDCVQFDMELGECFASLAVCQFRPDSGPGIPNLSEALRDGYSTYHGLGLGLPGARRLMDEFDIVTEVGTGTTVSMTKWR